MRALGIYAEEGGAGKGRSQEAVKRVFGAINAFDQDLFQTLRGQREADGAALDRSADELMQAFDAVLALLPDEAVGRARGVIERLAQEGAGAGAGAGGPGGGDFSSLEKLL